MWTLAWPVCGWVCACGGGCVCVFLWNVIISLSIGDYVIELKQNNIKWLFLENIWNIRFTMLILFFYLFFTTIGSDTGRDEDRPYERNDEYRKMQYSGAGVPGENQLIASRSNSRGTLGKSQDSKLENKNK